MNQAKYPVPRGAPGPQLKQQQSRLFGGLTATISGGDVLTQSLHAIECGVLAAAGGNTSGLHPIEQGFNS